MKPRGGLLGRLAGLAVPILAAIASPSPGQGALYIDQRTNDLMCKLPGGTCLRVTNVETGIGWGNNLVLPGTLHLGFTTVTGTYTVVSTDLLLLCNPSGGSFSVNLPAVASSRRRVLIAKHVHSANTVTLDGNGAETIDGSATRALAAREFAVLICDGSAWHVVGA